MISWFSFSFLGTKWGWHTRIITIESVTVLRLTCSEKAIRWRGLALTGPCGGLPGSRLAHGNRCVSGRARLLHTGSADRAVLSLHTGFDGFSTFGEKKSENYKTKCGPGSFQFLNEVTHIMSTLRKTTRGTPVQRSPATPGMAHHF